MRLPRMEEPVDLVDVDPIVSLSRALTDHLLAEATLLHAVQVGSTMDQVALYQLERPEQTCLLVAGTKSEGNKA